MTVGQACGSVAVSTRIRLARNFKDYPFPALLLKDAHGVEQATEIVRLISAELAPLDTFRLYDVGTLTEESAAYLVERHLISRDLLRHSKISAALINEDESISVMINEEDHLREQYFMKGFDLKKAYERVWGIDEVISASIPFAYDEMFGYLTACPTNLGSGMRASVMLFLPAIARRGELPEVAKLLARNGLVARGAYGEGSGSEGDLFQISNELTLGREDAEMLQRVENAVLSIAEMEQRGRMRMIVEEGIALEDRVMRSYGILSHCRRIDGKEFLQRTSDVKLGLALGFFSASKEKADKLMAEIDDMVVSTRPANLEWRNGGKLSPEEQDMARAGYAAEAFARWRLL